MIDAATVADFLDDAFANVKLINPLVGFIVERELVTASLEEICRLFPPAFNHAVVCVKGVRASPVGRLNA